MREVTGYYHMTAWRYRNKAHSIVVIASERRWAADAVVFFLNGNGYPGMNAETVWQKLKPVRSINVGTYVIVADFYKEE